MLIVTKRWGNEVDINSQVKDPNPRTTRRRTCWAKSSTTPTVPAKSSSRGSSSARPSRPTSTPRAASSRTSSRASSTATARTPPTAGASAASGRAGRPRGWPTDQGQGVRYGACIARSSPTSCGPPTSAVRRRRRRRSSASPTVLRPADHRRRGPGHGDPQVLGGRPLLHLRRDGGLHLNRALPRPLADDAGDRAVDEDRGAARRSPTRTSPTPRPPRRPFYIQDIAQWGPLRIIPAVRFDYFGLTASPDQFFANSNTQNFAIHDAGGDGDLAQARRHLRPDPELSPVRAVRARLPGSALRRCQLRLPQHLDLLRDPAQRQSQAGDQRRLRGAA